ncbi:hypothetical protein NLI96_g4248 [Meripilus lineatus]|uniref:F-box domain-containing protein n=1 Tax=Meripilus lineatus TaxID=2056292 RepID=A0AAD5V7H3_9APHY|nr:hypothetical protein NLI96_g4248 [Physisporinus lineatus]
MDSEDEAFLDGFDQHIRNKRWHLAWVALDSVKNLPGMKLYQKQEWELLKSIYHPWEDDFEGIDWSEDFSAIYRLRRLLDSIKGFHSGSLDYTGRHEYRYSRLNARWNRFLADILKISRHAKKTKVPQNWPDGTPMEIEGERVISIEYTMDRPELLEKFHRDWRTTALSLPMIFAYTKKLLEYLSDHPMPIFQKLRLQDFPPELIHHIMKVADMDVARSLGSASKYFKEVASSYIYVFRWLDMPFRPYEVDFATEEEERSYLESQVQRARDVLLDELNFLISRPDILNRILCISMFGRRYGEAKAKLEIETGSPEYMALFHPIESRIPHILKQTKHLRSLDLDHVRITPEVIEAIATFDLSMFSAHASELVEVSQLPRYPLVDHTALEIPSSGDVSLLAFVESLPNMRFLHLLGPSIGEMASTARIRAKLNPFSLLERLILERFDPQDFNSLVEWIQETENLQLTHVWVKGGGFGLFPFQITHILIALSPAPLQVLILDGLHEAEPDIFDEIAQVFPNLQALTLFYRTRIRQRESRPAVWPYPSWEYAPHFRGFHRLESFGWNFYVEMLEMPFHQTLRCFEDGFPEDWSEAEDDDDDFLADWGSIARVFAVYCPTLKYVLFDRATECQISRAADGGIEVTRGRFGGFSQRKSKLDHFPSSGHDWRVSKKAHNSHNS